VMGEMWVGAGEGDGGEDGLGGVAGGDMSLARLVSGVSGFVLINTLTRSLHQTHKHT